LGRSQGNKNLVDRKFSHLGSDPRQKRRKKKREGGRAAPREGGARVR